MIQSKNERIIWEVEVNDGGGVGYLWNQTSCGYYLDRSVQRVNESKRKKHNQVFVAHPPFRSFVLLLEKGRFHYITNGLKR